MALFDRIRHRRELEADDPAAPPGFLLDDQDDRAHEFVPRPPDNRWDADGHANRLARGGGEND